MALMIERVRGDSTILGRLRAIDAAARRTLDTTDDAIGDE
jgi:hypothetical protein